MVTTSSTGPGEEPIDPRIFRNISANEHFEAQVAKRATLPDPEVFMRNLTHRAVEILDGSREISQIARWVTDDVFASINRELIAKTIKRTALSPKIQSRLARPFDLTAVRLSEPRDGIVEGCVMVHTVRKVRVAAIRLEGLDRRWRATSFTLL
jgi:hypothetical protein